MTRAAARARPARRDQRSEQADAYRRLYRTTRWLRIRAAQLASHPLCRTCLEHGRITAATVCDHIDPRSKETTEGFFAGPFQSLCDAPPWRCHSRVKQSEERRAAQGKLPTRACDADGWPI